MATALPMVRQGSCSRCGECCTMGDPSLNGNPMFTDTEREAEDRVEGACPLYRRGDDGLAACLGYGSHPYYLAGCQGFPWGPGDLQPATTPSCTFYFEAAR